MILETLDTIPWHTLHHAYGEASDVPQLIRDFAFGESVNLPVVCDRLSSTIYHQGTVYSSTAYTIPFFLELLESEEVNHREWLLNFLIGIAHGPSYLNVHCENKDQRDTADFQHRLKEELSWVTAAKDAVSDSYLTFLRLLGQKKADIRAHAAWTLTCCQSHAEEIVPVLQQHLVLEEDKLVRASLIMSLSKLMPDNKRTNTFFMSFLQEQIDPLSKIVTAMAYVSFAREATSDAIIQILLNAYQQPVSIREEFNKLPFAEFEMDAHISETFCAIGFSVAPLVAPTLIQALKRSDFWSALPLVDNLFSLIFQDTVISNEMTVSDLTNLQREALTVLVESEEAWVLGDMKSIVGRFFEPRYNRVVSLYGREVLIEFLAR